MPRREQPEDTTRAFATIMQRSGLLKHPKYLSARDRKLQYMLLLFVSSNADALPNRKKWEEWYMWHTENKTECFDGLTKALWMS